MTLRPRLRLELVLAAALVTCVAYLWASRSALRADLRGERAEVARLETERNHLVTALRRQSDSVAALRAEGDSLGTRLEASRTRARRHRRRAERAAGITLATPIPTDCDSAAHWARAYADTLTRQWK